MSNINVNFWQGKRVFVTGHTGFKGMWLCRILQRVDAVVAGFALEAKKNSFYAEVVGQSKIKSYINDICNIEALRKAIKDFKPQILLHLAAQPIVIEAYNDPQRTFAINAQGTVNVLECLRDASEMKSIIIVTTDKVYKNNEWEYGYRENDVLGDSEPYAASKACAEICARSYFDTYFRQKEIAVSTVRAGNVIGGGDISPHRIVPDCVRAAKNKIPIIIRNRYSVRPYQHVLEPLFAYLLIAEKQFIDFNLSGQYNIGPCEADCITTGELANIFCDCWGEGQTWEFNSNFKMPHESGILKLDCSKMRSKFAWTPRWNVQTAMAKVVEWEKSEDKQSITDAQIDEYNQSR